jgi:hypothetical protein
MNLARLKQDCLRSLESFASPDRISHLNPPRRVLWLNLHKVTGEVCSQPPFPGRNVESQARSQDLDAGLVRERDLIERRARIVQHPQLEIPARGKDALLPIAVQGIGDSRLKAKRAFVATHMSTGKAPGASLEGARATSTTNSLFFRRFLMLQASASFEARPAASGRIYARPCGTCFRERQFYCDRAARLRNADENRACGRRFKPVARSFARAI